MKKETGSIRGVFILAAVAAVLALTPAAFAQSTGTGYAGQGGGVAGQVAPGGPPSGGGAGGAAEGAGAAPSGGAAAAEAGEPSEGGLLAFTGLDVALIVGVGLLLLAGGVALSRVVARNPA